MIQLLVTTHSGREDTVLVDTYDPVELEVKRNDNNIQSITIGENSYSRIDLKNVIKLEEVV